MPKDEVEIDAPFRFDFPALRGIQAGRSYYVVMCPVKLVPRIFSFDDSSVPPDIRAQRVMNKNRIPEIASPLLDSRFQMPILILLSR